MNQDIEIVAVGKITYDEFKQHHMYHVRKLLIGFFFISLFLEMCLCLVVNQMQISLLPVYLGISLLASGLLTYLLFIAHQKRINKEFRSDLLATKEITYTMNQEGIDYQAERTHIYVEWENIVKGKEYKDMFGLYTSTIKTIVLPKRYFKSDEDIMAFKQLISANTDKVKLKD
ncbi:YcxB family protein [Gracilibacillus timonensis]|uniref:YcxB family protein n=1 Tax=Gracilibacillus timonensis TaxID=1816696 RepID=UPI000825EA12|nr:YcxB family protein [Gracilibacillus timonensis]